MDLKFIGKVALTIIVINAVAGLLGLTTLIQNPLGTLGMGNLFGNRTAAA